MSGKENLNRGGNHGNVYGAGRKPNVVRQQYLDAAGDGIEWLKQVANGEQVIPMFNKLGKLTGHRHPAYQERKEAIEMCAKYGLGTRTDLTSGDEQMKNLVVLDI